MKLLEEEFQQLKEKHPKWSSNEILINLVLRKFYGKIRKSI
jgi:hypothetical protein